MKPDIKRLTKIEKPVKELFSRIIEVLNSHHVKPHIYRAVKTSDVLDIFTRLSENFLITDNDNNNGLGYLIYWLGDNLIQFVGMTFFFKSKKELHDVVRQHASPNALIHVFHAPEIEMQGFYKKRGDFMPPGCANCPRKIAAEWERLV